MALLRVPKGRRRETLSITAACSFPIEAERGAIAKLEAVREAVGKLIGPAPAVPFLLPAHRVLPQPVVQSRTKRFRAAGALACQSSLEAHQAPLDTSAGRPRSVRRRVAGGRASSPQVRDRAFVRPPKDGRIEGGVAPEMGSDRLEWPQQRIRLDQLQSV